MMAKSLVLKQNEYDIAQQIRENNSLIIMKKQQEKQQERKEDRKMIEDIIEKERRIKEQEQEFQVLGWVGYEFEKY